MDPHALYRCKRKCNAEETNKLSFGGKNALATSTSPDDESSASVTDVQQWTDSEVIDEHSVYESLQTSATTPNGESDLTGDSGADYSGDDTLISLRPSLDLLALVVSIDTITQNFP